MRGLGLGAIKSVCVYRERRQGNKSGNHCEEIFKFVHRRADLSKWFINKTHIKSADCQNTGNTNDDTNESNESINKDVIRNQANMPDKDNP